MKTLTFPAGARPQIGTDPEGAPVLEPSYPELLMALTNTSPVDGQGRPLGFTPELNRKRNRVAAAIEALAPDATALTLEDADAETLVAALGHVRWMRRSTWLEGFGDAVAALTKGA